MFQIFFRVGVPKIKTISDFLFCFCQIKKIFNQIKHTSLTCLLLSTFRKSSYWTRNTEQNTTIFFLQHPLVKGDQQCSIFLFQNILINHYHIKVDCYTVHVYDVYFMIIPTEVRYYEVIDYNVNHQVPLIGLHKLVQELQNRSQGGGHK